MACYAVTPQGIIRGRVFDRATGAGLPGANVILKKNQGTVTGDDGYFFLKTDAVSVMLSFRFIGYKTEVRSCRVIPNDTIFIEQGLEYEVSAIDQVVVSASRIEQRVSDLTVSMSVIKPELLSNDHISDPMELVNKTPGIEVLDGQASIRGGSGYAYGAGSRVLAMIDGLPVLAADAGNIKWQFLPLDNVSQVEIIKGASSVSYGSSALNGIINFRTADASADPETRYYIESGLFDSPRNSNWKWWGTLRTFSGIHFSHLQRFGSNDLGIGINFMSDNGYRKLNNENLARMNLKLKHRSSNVEGLSYGIAINTGNTRKTDFVQWENATTGALKQNESTAIELHGNFFTIDPFVSLHKEDSYKHDFRARMQASLNKFPESAKNNSNAVNYYAEYQFWKKLTGKIDMILGASENYITIKSQFYGDHNGLNIGSFAQFDINPADRLKFVAGLRLEHNSLDGINDKPALIFRTGINYKAFEHTFLRASFGQGYRYPAVAEKYASTTLGTVRIFPNKELEPESGWNSEIGFKQGVKAGNIQGQFDVALFLSESFNMIEYIFGLYLDPVDDSPSYGFKATNMEASRVYGCDLEYFLKGKAGRLTTTFSGGYTYMNPVEINRETKQATGVMLKYRRKHSAVFNLNNSYNKYDFGVSLFMKSKILNIDDVFVNPISREAILPGFYDYWLTHNKGYFLADATLGYSLNKKFRLSLVVKNLTNTEYMGRPGDIQPQRSFSLRLGGQF